MKVRKGYVSNSSSSSFIISCKGEKLAQEVCEAYKKLFNLFMELNPDYKGYGLKSCNYKKVNVSEIVEHFKENWMDETDISYYKESFEKEEKKGYIFLLGNCASDDGTPESEIMEMFNEYILSALRGRYDWKTESYKNDISLIFSNRWS